MKKLLFILSMFLFTSYVAKAQGDGDEKIRDRMIEFIQQRMNLNKTEAERFTPVFLRYFREWRSALRDYRTDKLILQQKIIDLQIRYRTEFKDIVGEKRCNEIYDHQRRFIKELERVNEERRQDIRRRPGGRFRALRLE